MPCIRAVLLLGPLCHPVSHLYPSCRLVLVAAPLRTDVWAFPIASRRKHQENYADDANLKDEAHEAHYHVTLKNTEPWADKIRRATVAICLPLSSHARRAHRTPTSTCCAASRTPLRFTVPACLISSHRVCRNYTTVCAKRIDDGYLDYVYVDARHDRKGVLVDLEAWWPKIRAGGILAGHDFTTQELWGSGPGEHQNWTINYDGSIDVSGRVVRGAVEDFAKRKNRQIQLTYKDGNLPSWAIRK